jgi:cell division septum initiation protein DivIVA
MEHEQPTELLPLRDPTSQFTTVLRGYDRRQVEEHVERLELDLRVALQDRDIAAARSADLAAQLAAARGEIEALRAKMQRLELPTPENIGERVRHMLALAEEEANDVRRRAHEEATALQARYERLAAEIDAKHRDADGYATRVVGEADARSTATLSEAEQKARQTLSEAEQKARQTLSEAEQKARQTLDGVSGECERLEAEAAAKRKQADEDFEIALRARRTEQAKVDKERREALAAEVSEKRRDAQGEAERTVAAAKRQVDRLRIQRRQILNHLAQVRQVLDGLPSAADLEAEEQAAEQAAGQSGGTGGIGGRPAGKADGEPGGQPAEHADGGQAAAEPGAKHSTN